MQSTGKFETQLASAIRNLRNGPSRCWRQIPVAGKTCDEVNRTQAKKKKYWHAGVGSLGALSISLPLNALANDLQSSASLSGLIGSVNPLAASAFAGVSLAVAAIAYAMRVFFIIAKPQCDLVKKAC